MTITNKKNLPEPFVSVVKKRMFKPTNYSASMLSRSAREVWLTRRYYDRIEKDVADELWALFGTAVHYILEKGSSSMDLSEEYLSVELDGVKVTGYSDYYRDAKVTDYKTTTVWKIVHQDFGDWGAQLNVYAYLYRQYGFPVDQIEVCAILKDWSRRKAMTDKTYPQLQVDLVQLPLWTEEQQEWWIRRRIAYFERYKYTPDANLPFCTEEEKWQGPTKYAVMKKGRKSAVKLHEDPAEADAMIAEKGAGHYLEIRPSEPTKCLYYCDARPFCSQFRLENSLQDRQSA